MFSPNFQLIIIASALLAQCCIAQESFSTLKTSSGRSAQLNAESQSIQNSGVDISSSSFSKSESSFAASETEISQNDSNLIASGDSLAVQDSSFYASDSSVSGSSSNVVASDGDILKTDSNFSQSSTIVSDVDSNFVATPDGVVQSSSKSFSAKKSSSSSTHSVTGQFSGSDESLFGGISSEESGQSPDLLNSFNKSSDSFSQTRSLNSLPALPDSIMKQKPFSSNSSFPSRSSNFPPRGPSGKPRGPNESYSRAGSFNSSKKPSSTINSPLGPTPSADSLLENLGSSSRDISTPLNSLTPLGSESPLEQISSPNEFLSGPGPNSPLGVPSIDSLSSSSPSGNDILNASQSPDSLINETSLNDISLENSPSSPFSESVTGDSILQGTPLSDQLSSSDSISQSPFGDTPSVIESETESFSTTTAQSETTYESVDEYPGSHESLIDFESDSPLDQYPSGPLDFDQSQLSQTQHFDSLTDSSGNEIPIEFISDSSDQLSGPFDSLTDFPSTSSSPVSPELYSPSDNFPDSVNDDSLFNSPSDSPLVNYLNEDNSPYPSSSLDTPLELYPSPDSFPSPSDNDLAFTSFQPYDSLDSPLSSDIPQNNIDDLFSPGNEISPVNTPLESLDTDLDGFISPEEILGSNTPLPPHSSPIFENEFGQPEYDLPDLPNQRYDTIKNSPLDKDYLKPKPFLPHGPFPSNPSGEIPFSDSPFSPFGAHKPFYPKPFSPHHASDLPPPFSHPGSGSGFPKYPLSPSRLDNSNLPLEIAFLKALSDLNKPRPHPFGSSSSPFLDSPYSGQPRPSPFSNFPHNGQQKPFNFIDSSTGLPLQLPFRPSPHFPGDSLSSSPLNGPFGPSPLKPTITSATFEPDFYQQSPFSHGKSPFGNSGSPHSPNFGDSFDSPKSLNQPSPNLPTYPSGILPNSPNDSTFPSPVNQSYPGSQLPLGRRPKILQPTPRPRYTPKNWSKISPLNSQPVSPLDTYDSISSPLDVNDSGSSPLDIYDSGAVLPHFSSPLDLSHPSPSIPHYDSPLDLSTASLPFPHSSPLSESSISGLQPGSSPLDSSPHSSPLFDSPLSNPLQPGSSPLDSTPYPSHPNLSPFPSSSINPLGPLSPRDEFSDDVFDILKQRHQSAAAEYLASNYIYPQDISPTLDSASDQDLTFEIAIVGSSPAALTALKTLLDLGKRILLIERGPLPPHISKSLYYRPRLVQSDYVRQIKSFAPYCDAHKVIYAPNVLGEESTYDSNVWDYGVKSKYFKWGKLCKKWTWSKVVHYFTGDLDHQSTCPIPTTRHVEETKATTVVTSIFNDAGLSRTEYIKGKRSEGLTIMPFLQENGENVILAHKIFEKLTDRSNINLALQTKVENILFDDYGKAIGVNVKTLSGAIRTIYVQDELILGSNPVDTVQLLYQSGIGEYERLQQLNLPVQINLPYVGKEFLVTPLYFGVIYQFPQGTLLNDWESDLVGMDYLFGKYQLPSALALDYFKAALNIYDSSEANVVLNFRVFSKSMAERLSSYIERFRYVDEKVKDYLLNLCQNHDLLLVVPQLTNVLSRGEIMIDNSSGEYEPVIDTGMYRTKRDMTIMQKALKVLKAIAETETFKSLNGQVIQIPVEQCGKPDFSTEYNRCSIRYLSVPNLHYSGGAIMGVDPLTSVVNEDLIVHGTHNLRILSSSVVPYGTSTDSGAVSSMIGNYGAHIITQNYQF